MKRVLNLILFVFLIGPLQGATLTLDSCQVMARRNHPLLRKAGLIDRVAELRKSNVESLNLPQFDLSARGSWQSDVTKLALSLPGIKGPEPLSKDQYKAYIDIRQKLYDGETNKKRYELEEADRKVNQQQNEVELYQIKETVNTLFFNNLIIQQNLKVIALKKETLEARIRVVTSAVTNGVTLPNDLDQLKAERLLTDQQEMEFRSGEKTTLALLELITGLTIPDSAVFVLPLAKITQTSNLVERPELNLFNSQRNKLDLNSDLIRNSRKPFVYAFGQSGYGRPGFNMLNNNFSDFYMVGAGLSWNIWDWHRSSHERSILKIQREVIDVAEANFQRGIKMNLRQEEENSAKLQQLIATDRSILDLKERIAKRSAVALENGTINSADYIRDLNAMLQAKSNLETRTVQLIQSSINYNNIKGQ